MKWISIDPANTSGVAQWQDDTLESTVVVKPRGSKGRWYCGTTVVASRLLAWESAYSGVEAVVIERGFGAMATAVRAQGMQIGWHHCMCAYRGLPEPIEVNVSEWRRVIKEDQQVSWPQDRKRAKSLSIAMVHGLYGVTVGDDAADAVLMGRAALRMKLL